MSLKELLNLKNIEDAEYIILIEDGTAIEVLTKKECIESGRAYLDVRSSTTKAVHVVEV